MLKSCPLGIRDMKNERKPDTARFSKMEVPRFEGESVSTGFDYETKVKRVPTLKRHAHIHTRLAQKTDSCLQPSIK